MEPLFDDRAHAGRLLAPRVQALGWPHPLVVALPRGGVAVATEVARRLQVPLELLLVRKIGAPWQPERAVAAVVDGLPPELVVDESGLAQAGVERAHVEAQVREAVNEIERRRAAYLGDRRTAEVAGRDVVLVDDGLATGITARAALRALRQRGTRRLALAVPVGAADSVAALQGEADEIVCLATPWSFFAVSPYYRRFEQLTDAQVIGLLRQAATDPGRA